MLGAPLASLAQVSWSLRQPHTCKQNLLFAEVLLPICQNRRRRQAKFTPYRVDSARSGAASNLTGITPQPADRTVPGAPLRLVA